MEEADLPNEQINEQQKRLLKGLCDLYADKALTDVTLVTEGVEFPCHRNVLAATSSYFRAMFTSAVRESEQTTVQLHGIKPDALGTILAYIYTGKVEVNVGTAQDILMAANLMNMTQVIDACTDYMASKITPENCLELHQFAVYHSYQSLMTKSKDYLLTHYLDLQENDDQLCSLDFESMLEFVSSDELNVEDEETVFESVIDWVRYDFENRKRYMAKLLQEVRLPLISDDYFRETVESCALIVNDPFSRSILTTFKIHKLQMAASNVSSSFLDSVQSTEDFQFNSRMRLGMHKKQLIVFSGGANKRDNRSLTAFDPITKMNYSGIKHHPTFDFKFKIDHYELITLGNSIYFLGGIFYEDYHFDVGGTALEDAFVFDWKSISWVKKPPMPTARCCFSACCFENLIFAIGGKGFYPTGTPLDKIEKYDTEEDSWEILADIPIKICQHSSAVHEDAIFVFGGIDEDEEHLDTVLRYEIPTDSWTLVSTEMRRPKAECISIPYNNKIYVLGGASKHENNITLDVYDPEINKWKYEQDFPEERKILAATRIGNGIYVCGGLKHSSSRLRRSRTVEIHDLYFYDLRSKEWRKEVKLVQYANMQRCTTAVLNTMFLQESDYVSFL
ncbi:hypothetical protein ScPMuIL_015979 [Solemya velum]